ncbi:MAG: glycosyltransferase [Candidatus Omnitrophota bacterium]
MAKTLIVYASFGEGHKRAAFALKYLPDTQLCDLLSFTHPFLRNIYSLSYLAITQYFPWLWKGLFFFAKQKLFSSWLNRINRSIFSKFFKYLRDRRPGTIIVTHFFASSLIATLKNELNCKVVAVITDLRVHPLWVAECIDHYFAALEVTKRDLINLGVANDKITFGYVPLRVGFLKKIPIEYLRKKFSLNPRPILIFVSSLRGRFPYLKAAIKTLVNDFNIFLIYGKNKKLKKCLEDLDSPYIRFFSFYDQIWEFFSASTIIISKPGGMTIFEGLYKRKPFIFTHYIPGQERANMALLIKYGIARFVRGAEELVAAVHYYNTKSSELQNNYPLEVKDIRKPLLDLIARWGNA